MVYLCSCSLETSSSCICWSLSLCCRTEILWMSNSLFRAATLFSSSWWRLDCVRSEQMFVSILNISFQEWMNHNTKSFICIYQNTECFISVYSLCWRLYASESFIFVRNESPLLFYLHIHPRHTKSATVPPQPAGETWLPLLGRRFPPACAVRSCVVPLCCGPAPAVGWGTDTFPPALQHKHAGQSSPSAPSAIVLSAW